MSIEAPSAPTRPPIPATYYGIVSILQFVSGNVSIPSTYPLVELVGEIRYDEDSSTLTITSEEGETTLTGVYRHGWDCSLENCRLYVDGWISVLGGETQTRLGTPTPLWGKALIELETAECQAPGPVQAHRARHRN